MTKTTTHRPIKRGVIIAIFIVILLGITAMVLVNITPGKKVETYEQCKDAGGTIAESYPEQCIINGKTYINNSITSGNKTDTGEATGYVGLSEQDALQKAANEKKAARVVMRNGEGLPVTMDFSPGRLNLTVNNGVVEKVEVEK